MQDLIAPFHQEKVERFTVWSSWEIIRHAPLEPPCFSTHNKFSIWCSQLLNLSALIDTTPHVKRDSWVFIGGSEYVEVLFWVDQSLSATTLTRRCEGGPFPLISWKIACAFSCVSINAKKILAMYLSQSFSVSSPSWAFCSVIVYICIIPKKLLLGEKTPSRNASGPSWPLDPLAEDKRGLPNSSQAAVHQH